MSETFVTASTQIGDLVRKREQIIEKTAGLVSEVIMGRVNDGNLARSNEKDVLNLIKDFSVEEQNIILVKALIITGMNSSSSSSSNDIFESARKRGSRSDLFRR